eukprot:m51a1_g14577 hypothetical protein (682) ;mRNA; r:1085213-1093571
MVYIEDLERKMAVACKAVQEFEKDYRVAVQRCYNVGRIDLGYVVGEKVWLAMDLLLKKVHDAKQQLEYTWTGLWLIKETVGPAVVHIMCNMEKMGKSVLTRYVGHSIAGFTCGAANVIGRQHVEGLLDVLDVPLAERPECSQWMRDTAILIDVVGNNAPPHWNMFAFSVPSTPLVAPAAGPAVVPETPLHKSERHGGGEPPRKSPRLASKALEASKATKAPKGHEGHEGPEAPEAAVAASSTASPAGQERRPYNGRAPPTPLDPGDSGFKMFFSVDFIERKKSPNAVDQITNATLTSTLYSILLEHAAANKQHPKWLPLVVLRCNCGLNRSVGMALMLDQLLTNSCDVDKIVAAINELCAMAPGVSKDMFGDIATYLMHTKMGKSVLTCYVGHSIAGFTCRAANVIGRQHVESLLDVLDVPLAERPECSQWMRDTAILIDVVGNNAPPHWNMFAFSVPSTPLVAPAAGPAVVPETPLHKSERHGGGEPPRKSPRLASKALEASKATKAPKGHEGHEGPEAPEAAVAASSTASPAGQERRPYNGRAPPTPLDPGDSGFKMFFSVDFIERKKSPNAVDQITNATLTSTLYSILLEHAAANKQHPKWLPLVVLRCNCGLNRSVGMALMLDQLLTNSCDVDKIVAAINELCAMAPGVSKDMFGDIATYLMHTVERVNGKKLEAGT